MPEAADITDCPVQDITGVILAGGRGRRMQGADKGLITVDGRPLIEQVIAALRPQVGTLVISANRNHERYTTFGYPVIADRDGEFAGPLAGMASSMAAVTTPYLLVVPCDAPRIPATLARGLCQALVAQHADLSVVHDGTRVQPLFALVRRTLLPHLQAWLAGGRRRAESWVTDRSAALADFSAQAEAFLNINTPADFDALGAVPDKRCVNDG